jgi:epoxyqueuosine reductase
MPPATLPDAFSDEPDEGTARRRDAAGVKRLAGELGFAPVGIAPAGEAAHRGFYEKWLDLGYAAGMTYLGRDPARRADVRKVMPGARCVVCVGMNYQPAEPEAVRAGSARGRVARYARGHDYHDVMKDRLEVLASGIREVCPGSETRVYVDTGPVLERDVAARAGLGWFGKHTNLIHKRQGSWFFLGEVITTADLAWDAPATDHCGTCVRCLEACPTGALPEPYLLDSNRCISYLTIELKGSIPRPLRALIGDWVLGCDICQEVCPWSLRHAQPTSEPAFQARPGMQAPVLRELLEMDQAEFSRRFKGSPVKRAKRRGLLRNAAVALGNTGGPGDVPVLERALQDDEPLVRAHAAWALGRIGGGQAREALTRAARMEMDADVKAEIDDALSDVSRAL